MPINVYVGTEKELADLIYHGQYLLPRPSLFDDLMKERGPRDEKFSIPPQADRQRNPDSGEFSYTPYSLRTVVVAPMPESPDPESEDQVRRAIGDRLRHLLGGP